MNKIYISLIFFFLQVTYVFSFDDGVYFNATRDVRVTVKAKENNVMVSFAFGGNIVRQDFKFDSEKSLHVVTGDFNFDGRTDFSVWHTDDGMGVYTIHRIFIYKPGINRFVEIFPSCGDEFINLKINKKIHSLISTYYEENMPKTCITKIKK